ncbi:MAG TPA: NAD(P)/FAD-dependent oxidoreductase [Syntrophomonadaceae bacterium]|nr:NAD(P)/FAD-dependent oxidoreductase [Syntrophomonadaceae bacterium]
MHHKSIIIIGGGLAGLSTGCYGRMNEYYTHILEHHTQPGGLCTAWKKKGYTMDGCIHWLMSCKPEASYRQVYDELGAFQGNKLMMLDDFCSFYDQKSGNRLDFTSDLERLASNMRSLAPEDEKAVDEFIQCCQALREFDPGIPEPRELLGPLSGMKMMWQVRHILKYVLKYNMSVVIYAQRFKNDFLRHCIINLFVPEMPAYFLFAVMGQLIGGQLGCVEGASQRFSNAIAQRYKDLGGKISYKAMVEKIIVEDNRAVGVRLTDGTEERADIVVSAADAHSTIFDMLDGKYIDAQIRSRFSSWPLFKPLVLLSYGVAREYVGEKSSQIISLKSPVTVMGKEIKEIFLRIFNYDSTLAPVGKTVLQATLETDYEPWMELVKDEAAYNEEKSRVAAEIMTRIEELYPGTSQALEVTDVATPYTFWHYTRNYRASYEGWLMTREASQTLLPKTLPGLDNFYMAGQWVEPGGGIPPALYSGRNLVRILCELENRVFITTIPQ